MSDRLWEAHSNVYTLIYLLKIFSEYEKSPYVSEFENKGITAVLQWRTSWIFNGW